MSHYTRKQDVILFLSYSHPLFFQHLAGLCPGIVKFTSLADDDGAGADNHNFLRSFLLGILLIFSISYCNDD